MPNISEKVRQVHRRTDAILKGAAIYGTTNTRILNFTGTIKASNDDVITVSQDAALGTSITANMKCKVWMSYSMTFTDPAHTGITKNGTSLSSNISGAGDEIVAASYTSSINAPATTVFVGELEVGDVLRPHTNGREEGANTFSHRLSVYAEEIVE